MNGGLSAYWGNPQQTALFSFGSGLVILTVIVFASPALRRSLTRGWEALRSGGLRWWEVIGGLLGGLFVLSQSAIVPIVGVAAFTVGVVAGQTANSLLVDRWGIGPQGRIPVSGRRILAAVIAVAAVITAVTSRLGESTSGSMLAIGLSFVVGVMIAFQQAINGRVTVVTQQPLAATWLNFALGTLLLLVIFAVSVSTGSSMAPLGGASPILYVGGAIGVVFIAFAAWSVTRLGVLVTSLLAISGQLVSAVVLDVVSPTSQASVTAGLIAGAVLAFVAVFVGTGYSRSR